MSSPNSPICFMNPVFRVGVCGFMYVFGHWLGWKKEVPNRNFN